MPNANSNVLATHQYRITLSSSLIKQPLQSGNRGKLILNVPFAVTYLDTSSSIAINHQSLSVDTYLQPINSFARTWVTPIEEASCSDRFTYPWQTTPDGELLYPLALTAKDWINPWWLERQYATSDRKESRPVLTAITTDGTSRVDSLEVIGIPVNSAFTSDLESVIQFLTPELTDPDFRQLDASRTKMYVERLPYGRKFLSYVNTDDRVESQTWYDVERGYLPASTLNSSMTGADLFDTAWALLGLIATNDDRLLALALKELVYVWANYLENLNSNELNPNAVAGFPTFLPRYLSDKSSSSCWDSSRSILANSWLGIAVVKAVKYLRDRKVEDRRDLPTHIDLLLNSLARFIASSVDIVRGFCPIGYDESGYLITQLDFSSTVAAGLFLSEYLTIEYDTFVHQRLSRLHLAVSNSIGENSISFDDIEDNVTISNSYLYQAIWLFKYAKSKDLLEAALQNFFKFKAEVFGSLPSSSIAVGIYLINHLVTTQLLPSSLDASQWKPSAFYTRYDRGVYGRDNKPDLLASAVSILVETEFNLFQGKSFDPKSEEAFLSTTYSYQTGRRLWPFGYRWNSEEAQSPYSGILGALLYAQAMPSFEWYVTLALFKEGRDVSLARGLFLNLWGYSLGLKRPLLQSDEYFRQSTLACLNNPRSSKVAIEQWIKEFYTDTKVEILEPQIPTIYRLVEGSWQKVVAANLSELMAVVLVGNGTTPGYYYFQLGKSTRSSNASSPVLVFVNWQDVSSSLIVTVKGKYLPEFEEDILKIKSAGISAHIKLLLTGQTAISSVTKLSNTNKNTSIPAG